MSDRAHPPLRRLWMFVRRALGWVFVKRYYNLEEPRWRYTYLYCKFRIQAFFARRELERRRGGGYSFAVLTRLSVIELPYTRSFLDYYIDLGVRTIHIQVTRDEDHEEVREYLAEYVTAGRVKLYSIVDKGANLDWVYNEMLPYITEDFVLNIDLDEYLSVAPCANLTEFIAENPYPYIYFKWEVVPHDEFKSDRAHGGDSVGGAHGKYLVLRRLTKTLHHHMMYESEKPSAGKLIHVWGRSFNDVLLKILHQIYNCGKKLSSKKQTLELLAKDDIPVRLKLLAWLCTNPSDPLEVDPVTVNIDSALERRLLSRYLGDSEVAKLRELYLKFKDRVCKPGVFEHSYPEISIVKASLIIGAVPCLDAPRSSSRGSMSREAQPNRD